MAKSTINFEQSKTSGKYIDSKIEWSSTPNNDDNNSDVTAKLYVRKGDTTQTLTKPTSGTWSYKLTINDKSTSGTIYLDVLEEWVEVCSFEVKDISHDSDGSKSITLSGSVSAPSASSYKGHTTSGNGTAVLDTIPRASTIDSLSCATKYFDGAMTYKYTPQNSSYYNICNISLNVNGEYVEVKTINLDKKPASQQTDTVTLTASELATIYNELPNSNEGTLRFALTTYSDSEYSNQVGDAEYKDITLYIPENSSTKPSVSMTLTPVSSLASPFDAMYIQGKSKVRGNISASGKNNATIISCNLNVGGNTYDSGDEYTSAFLSQAGTIKITSSVKDSRGFTGNVEDEITVYPYDKPKIQPVSGESEVIAARCDKNGDFVDSGTYLKIKAKRNYSSLSNKNTCKIRYRYKAETAQCFSDWITIHSETASGDEVITAPLLNGGLFATNTYIVQVGVIDAIEGEAYTTIVIPTDKVYMHRDGARNALGLGKYNERDNAIDSAWDFYMNGNKITGLPDPIDDTDAVSLGFLKSFIGDK